MNKLTKQLKSMLLIMLCVILIGPSMNVSAATQRQKAMAAYKNVSSGSRVYVVPNNQYIMDFFHFRRDYHGSLPKNVYFGLAYIDGDSIPELVLQAKCNGITIYSVWTYKNGKAYRAYYNRGTRQLRGYFQKTGMFKEKGISGDYSYAETYYKLSGTTSKFMLDKWVFTNGNETDYWIGTRTCTAKAYAAKLKSLTKGLKMKKISFVKNTGTNRKAKLK